MKLSKTKEQKIIKTLREHRQLMGSLTKGQADHQKVLKCWTQYQAYRQGVKDVIGLESFYQLERKVQ